MKLNLEIITKIETDIKIILSIVDEYKMNFEIMSKKMSQIQKYLIKKNYDVKLGYENSNKKFDDKFYLLIKNKK